MTTVTAIALAGLMDVVENIEQQNMAQALGQVADVGLANPNITGGVDVADAISPGGGNGSGMEIG